jgi:hypothetical protein
VVKIGFICEGDTDKMVLESANFQDILTKFNLECVRVEDAGGNGNLLPQHIEKYRNSLQKFGATKIIILTDLDENACITFTKERLKSLPDEVVVISVKTLESWFLADSQVMSQLVGKDFNFEFPEIENTPFETIKRIFQEETSRGVGTKRILARRLLKYGFSIQNAANHPNCPSAKYFLTKLQSITNKEI